MLTESQTGQRLFCVPKNLKGVNNSMIESAQVIESPVDFLSSLITSDRGYTQVFCPDTRFARYFYRGTIENVPDMLDVDRSYYFTPNSLKGYQRTIDNVKVLNALYADFDAIKQGFTPEQAYFYITNELEECHMPKPTTVINTGHGIHVYWFIEAVHVNSPVVVLLWDKIEKTIIKNINSVSDIKADSKATSVVQLMRLPGSYNCKVNSERLPVTILEHNPDYIYSLKYFQDELLPKRNAQTQKRKANIKILKTFTSLDIARAKDIELLVQLRQGEMDGVRELTLFLYANFIHQYTKDWTARVIDLNQTFKHPLSDREVEQKVLKYADRRYYKLKTATLIEWLDITNAEQKTLSALIGSAEKKARKNNKAKEKTKIKKQQRDFKIIELYKSGLNKTSIARELNVSRPTVIRVIKQHSQV